MIEKKIRTTQGKLRVKIPVQLSELTLGQMMALQENPGMNDLEAISILSGIPLTELNNVRSMADLQQFGEHVLALSLQIKYLYNSDEIPRKVTFILDEKPIEIKVIQNLSVEPAGAFMAARDIIADEINEHIKQNGDDDLLENFTPSLKACCHILAHYFYCRATDNKYDEYEAEKFSEHIKTLRVTEALPIAKHFFTVYPSLSKPRTGFFQRILQQWRNGRVSIRSKSLSISIP